MAVLYTQDKSSQKADQDSLLNCDGEADFVPYGKSKRICRKICFPFVFLGPGEGSDLHISPGEGSALHIDPGEGSALDIDPGEVSALYMGPGEGSANQIGLGEGSTLQIGPGEGFVLHTVMMKVPVKNHKPRDFHSEP